MVAHTAKGRYLKLPPKIEDSFCNPANVMVRFALSSSRPSQNPLHKRLVPMLSHWKTPAALFTVSVVTFLLSISCFAGERVLYSFTGGSDGAMPVGTLVSDSSGNLYGVTNQGGIRGIECSGGCGTVFELINSGGQWIEQTLHEFNGLDGGQPYGSLLFDSQGNLYGTTSVGGTHRAGTVYRLSRTGSGWTHTILYNFCSFSIPVQPCLDGANPGTGLVMDSAGNIYGTTLAGGAPRAGPDCQFLGGPLGCGTVFKLSPQSGNEYEESVLYSFCSVAGCADGISPESNLVITADGTLYGTTVTEGTGPCGNIDFQGCGTLFFLTEGSNGQWMETSQSFNGVDGQFPRGTIVSDSAGNVYGTTAYGGAGFTPSSGATGNGVVFAYISGTAQLAVLHDFCLQTPLGAGCPDGSNPDAGVTIDSDGNLYGTAYSGGIDCNLPTGCGVSFVVAKEAGGMYQVDVLNAFNGLDGASPDSALTVFQLGRPQQTFPPLSNRGRCPYGCYGCTGSGGAYNSGIVFEITAD